MVKQTTKIIVMSGFIMSSVSFAALSGEAPARPSAPLPGMHTPKRAAPAAPVPETKGFVKPSRNVPNALENAKKAAKKQLQNVMLASHTPNPDPNDTSERHQIGAPNVLPTIKLIEKMDNEPNYFPNKEELQNLFTCCAAARDKTVKQPLHPIHKTEIKSGVISHNDIGFDDNVHKSSIDSGTVKPDDIKARKLMENTNVTYHPVKGTLGVYNNATGKVDTLSVNKVEAAVLRVTDMKDACR